MQETAPTTATKSHIRLNIRISRNALSFSIAERDAIGQAVYEPYIVKSGISMAANLREAFRCSDLLMQEHRRSLVLTDSPTLLIPTEEFEPNDIDQLFHHTFSGHQAEVVLSQPIPNLDAMAVFSINKDLKTVIEDHFIDIRFIPLMLPVWNHLHKRSQQGTTKKLYGYFHDKKLEVFSFQHNRFRFSNSYNLQNQRDAVYFLLFVWTQLGLNAEQDELHIIGQAPEEHELMQTLRKYVQKVFLLTPSADFNEAPVTKVKGMPYDLTALFVNGR